jgi:shikimate kinase
MINNHMITQGMPNMNSHMMLDNFKSMMLTMAMVKSSSQTDSKSSFMNTLLIMLIVSFIDTIVAQIKKVCGILANKIEIYINKKTNDISILGKITSSYLKIKKSSIIVKIESASKNPTSDAIIDILTHLPHTKCILYANGIYSVNYSEEIEISKGLYAQLVNSPNSQMALKEPTNDPATTKHNSTNLITNDVVTDTASQQASSETSVIEKNGGGYIELYSFTLNMEELRDELNNIVKNFLIKMTNKLGNNIYYFSELPMTVYRDNNGKIDHSKSYDSLHFTMKQFVTNRSFKNLFGKDVNVIRKRVEFFKDNKNWYDDKGVPYTLGILVSGNPGSGKTSIIKCIANELKRHIINIHLSDTMTKTQVENLFYNEQLYITQNGKTETYTIPINKRIYVLEDIDCQCDIILDRENASIEQILAKKNDELKKEVEKLKFALSEMSNGKKMVMTGGDMPRLNEKKDTDTSQKITLSFLLNLFDGVLETPGRITFMTTNFIDKLDKAFTRPGRIDVIGRFGFADHSQLIAIIEHRYDTKLTDEQITIINNTHQCVTPAEISRILFENFDNLDGALDGLVNYVDEYIRNEKTKKAKENETKMKIALLESEANNASGTTPNSDTTLLNNLLLDDNATIPIVVNTASIIPTTSVNTTDYTRFNDQNNLPTGAIPTGVRVKPRNVSMEITEVPKGLTDFPLGYTEHPYAPDLSKDALQQKEEDQKQKEATYRQDAELNRRTREAYAKRLSELTYNADNVDTAYPVTFSIEEKANHISGISRGFTNSGLHKDFNKVVSGEPQPHSGQFTTYSDFLSEDIVLSSASSATFARA